MKSHYIRTTPVEVFRGEIVQLWNAEHEAFRIELFGEEKPRIAIVRSGQKIKSSAQFPIKPGNTVQEVLEAWLADMPSSTAEMAAAALGLEKHLHTAISEAGRDLRYRLQTLKAILDGAHVIAFGDHDGVVNVTSVIIAVREFAENYKQKAGEIPAFVVLDEGSSTGAVMAADRVLKIKHGKIRELLVDY